MRTTLRRTSATRACRVALHAQSRDSYAYLLEWTPTRHPRLLPVRRIDPTHIALGPQCPPHDCLLTAGRLPPARHRVGLLSAQAAPSRVAKSTFHGNVAFCKRIAMHCDGQFVWYWRPCRKRHGHRARSACTSPVGTHRSGHAASALTKKPTVPHCTEGRISSGRSGIALMPTGNASSSESAHKRTCVRNHPSRRQAHFVVTGGRDVVCTAVNNRGTKIAVAYARP